MRRNILITGASSGLGRGMARAFAARGRNLALCARRADLLAEVRAELAAAYPDVRVAVRRLDVRDYEATAAAFRSVREELGGLDRVVVNAGLGAGVSVGTGGFATNRATAETNFVAGLAQCEAAMEIFRERGEGHLVVMSSVSAVRGMPRHLTAYAASKAAVATLADGIRADTVGTRLKVTTLFPGYIRTEMNEDLDRTPFIIDRDKGCELLVRAMEREPARAHVPAWPWAPAGAVLRRLPVALVAKSV
ncbi:SDR family oxidoreductase [Streptomyces sp. NBC_00334]|uniref:SDR family oxidoreductase n=1 Tax=Streptomyces sp. NBC_00334 TaxID=2975713 RepID=UPI002E284A1C|nr:SDR family oxidoreductase [Streptomyces sp. NBC_00334]